MDSQIEPSGIASDFAALSSYLSDGTERDVGLHRLVQLAVGSVSGCDWGAVTAWPAHATPRSLACSDPVAFSVDELQYALGEGPSLEPAASTAPVWIPDLARDVRWPRFCMAVQAETPVRGLLSFDLDDDSGRAALNLYSSRPDVFGTEAATLAALFATHAKFLLLHAEPPDDADGVQRARLTSRQIGMAIGILVDVHQVSEESALAMLRVTSQHLNRKLRDVAGDVARTGRLPARDSRPRDRAP